MTAFFILIRVTLLSFLAGWLALQSSTALWIVGELLLGLAFLQWFVLLNDFSSGVFFKSKFLNFVLGSVASIVCLVPLVQFREMQRLRRIALTQGTPDPTQETSEPPFAPTARKLWLPTYTLRYSLKNFWNVARLFRMFPDQKTRWLFVYSLILMQVFFFLLRPLIPHFFLTWLPGYLLFLVLVDPLIYFQYQTDQSLRFAHWIERHVLFNYCLFAERRQHPSQPAFQLRDENKAVNWRWIFNSKYNSGRT